MKLIGRKNELEKIRACVVAGRNVLLEGPVGVGKTHLALAVTQELKRQVFRVDGDSRYSEQKLSGWFDPPSVLKKGFTSETFVPGPLVEAMRAGGVLFVNELNRLPEGVQNVLLPAIDEGILVVPRLGQVEAKAGFMVIATQNPKEFVATSHLSEAILDRFELVLVDYQAETEEVDIVTERVGLGASKHSKLLPLAAVRLVQATRTHPKIRRGSSIRGAVSIAELTIALMEKSLLPFGLAFTTAAQMALPTRIEIEPDGDTGDSTQTQMQSLLKELSDEVLQGLGSDPSEKKKT